MFMIWLYLRSVKTIHQALRGSLVLVYGLVLLASALFTLRYYSQGAEHPVLAISQVLSYYLGFAALWHVLMALVASGINGINVHEAAEKSKEYDPNAKTIINM